MKIFAFSFFYATLLKYKIIVYEFVFPLCFFIRNIIEFFNNLKKIKIKKKYSK